MEKMVKVNYKLSEKGQKKSILTGGDGKVDQSFETPVTEKLLDVTKVTTDGNIILDVNIPSVRYMIKTIYPTTTGIRDIDGNCFKGVIKSVEYVEYIKSYNSFDEPQTIESILLAYNEVFEKGNELTKNMDVENKKLEQEYFERLEKVKLEYEIKRKSDEREKIKQKTKEEERKLYESEKNNWIEQHGSQYLKDCLNLDIKANREYVIERASKEFPDYEVDYNDNADWNDILSPSESIVNELKILRKNGVDSFIIWLKKPIETNYYDYDYEPKEAILIQNYLGKYNLIKVV
jgi:hypothetical protein